HRLIAQLQWLGDNQAELSVNGVVYRSYCAQDGNALFIHLAGRVWRFTALDEFGAIETAHDDSEGVMRAPMPGVVVEVNVEIGQAVDVGQSLILIESMKLQSEIKSRVSGIVRA